VVRRCGRILLCQRGDAGRWAGMWEFPRTALAAKESPAAGARRLGRALYLRVQSKPRQIIKHTVTHHDISLCVFDAKAARATMPALENYTRFRWIYPAQLMRYPIARPQRQILIDT
jgi:A/G-specific adenine glycosylase